MLLLMKEVLALTYLRAVLTLRLKKKMYFVLDLIQ